MDNVGIAMPLAPPIKLMLGIPIKMVMIFGDGAHDIAIHQHHYWNIPCQKIHQKNIIYLEEKEHKPTIWMIFIRSEGH